MTTLLKQSTNRNVMVLMVDETDNETGLAGLTLTITASKDGGSFGGISPTVTDRGNGNYALALSTSHTDTLGDFVLHIEATGANDYDEKFQVVTDLPGATVASVVGNVGGNVVGNVNGSVATAGAVTGDIGGNVVGNVNGTVTLSSATILNLFRTTLSEAYVAKNANPTLEQFVFTVLARLFNEHKNGQTVEFLGRDGTTVKKTITLNDAEQPTLIVEAS